jgi:HAMP domain-containing protein
MFGLMSGVLGLDNREMPGKSYDLYNGLSIEQAMAAKMPNPEYVRIHSIGSYFFSIFNIALGNFALVNSIGLLPIVLQQLFWVLFIFAVFAILIVFINFVVAKAMASHAEATQHLEAVMNKERVDMIDEVEALVS